MNSAKMLAFTAVSIVVLVSALGAVTLDSAATATARVAAAASEATVTAPALTSTPGPTTVVGSPTVEPAPPTPGPPSPTPRLPEEGGPPGGIIAGHLYVDSDGSRSRTPGDGAAEGSIVIDRLAGRVPVAAYAASGDATGFWEVRGLPDGEYRVMWQPPIPNALLSQTIPPATTIVLNPIDTIRRVTAFVTIRGANRVTNIDFGIPSQAPAVGVQMPSTGGASGGQASPPWPIVAASLVLGGTLALGLFLSKKGA